MTLDIRNIVFLVFLAQVLKEAQAVIVIFQYVLLSVIWLYCRLHYKIPCSLSPSSIQYEYSEHHLTTVRLSTSYLSLQSFNDEFIVYSNYMWNELHEYRFDSAVTGNTYRVRTGF